MKSFLLAALTLAMIVPASGQAGAEAGDAQISSAVARAIRSYSRLTIFDDVHARVEGDIVTIIGKVTAAEKKDELEHRLLEVTGVQQVRNAIDVLPASESDDALRRKVGRAIYGNAAFWRYAAASHPPIRVLVENGVVTLTGMVSSDVERALAGTLGAGHGEMRLTNALTVGR